MIKYRPPIVEVGAYFKGSLRRPVKEDILEIAVSLMRGLGQEET